MIVITTMNALPDYCYDCPCHNGENGQCRADANRRYVTEYRPYWCPLKDTVEEKELHPCEKCQEWECDGCPHADEDAYKGN